jgi:ribose transport system substrate-binding protein
MNRFSRRSALALAVTAVAAPLTPACKGKAEAHGYKFAFVTNNSSEFWNIAVNGVKKAERDLGVQVQVFRPLKGEVAEQQRYLEDILVLGFDGLAISPVNAEAMTPALNRMAEKMNVVCQDSDAPSSKRKSYVGTKNLEAGRAAGAAAVAALQASGVKQGKAAIFVGRVDVENAVERKQGVEEALTKAGLEVLPVFLDGTDRAKAKKNIEDALARYPDLVLAVGLWSYNGPAIAGAIRASAREKRPVVIAFDEEEETLKAIEGGTIDATIVQQPFEFGYQSVKLLKDAKDGKAVPASVDTGIVAVKKENLNEFWARLRELKK